MTNKVDSNSVGLRYAEELADTIGTLPGSPVWYPIEPNGFGEFGAQYKQVARETINASRQRRKGSITDLDVTGGFSSDFTSLSLFDIMQGFFFADWRKKTEMSPTAVAAGSYTVASGGTGFLVNSLIWAQGFTNSVNNGLKLVTASTGTSVSAAGTVVETPPAGDLITRVGHRGALGDLTLTVNGGKAQLNSTALNFTTLGLIPGEWLWLGGDIAVNQFATAALNGFYRIQTIAANAILFDRAPTTPAADTGATKLIDIYFAHVIKNESSPALIKQRSYHLERYFGTAGPGYEYAKGCVANTLEIEIKQADKIELQFGFIGTAIEDAPSAKTGTRPSLPKEEVFNASSDFSRLRMLNELTQATLFTYLTDLKLTIDNNVEVAKSIAILGGFDVNVGDFSVAGSAKAYFATTDAANAIRNNSDVSLDFALVKGNPQAVGYVFDIPLVTLGDGRRSVERNKPIMMDLSANGVAHPTLDHTLMVNFFTYLPQLAT